FEVLHQPLGAARSDDAVGRRASAEVRRQPAGEPEVRHPRRVVGVVVGQKLHVDAADRDFELIEPHGRATTGVDENLLVAGFDHRARAETVWARDRHAGPEQGDAKVACGHVLILMPASLITLVQRTISPFTKVPKASGVPPPGSVPSLPSASRSLSVLSALLIASLSRATVAGGVPAFTMKPPQSSDASCG